MTDSADFRTASTIAGWPLGRQRGCTTDFAKTTGNPLLVASSSRARSTQGVVPLSCGRYGDADNLCCVCFYFDVLTVRFHSGASVGFGPSCTSVQGQRFP
jgi:hypothetical protein